MKLTEDIGSQVEIDEAGGKLIIDYYGNLDVLDGVLKKISSFKAFSLSPQNDYRGDALSGNHH